jgi:DNA-binding beta-propeller fold protein YncE
VGYPGHVLTRILAIGAAFAIAIGCPSASALSGPSIASAAGLNGPVLYVANDDGSITAYQIGTWRRVARWTGLPIQDGVRGVAYRRGFLYIAHGGDGAGAHGGLLKWNVATAATVYNRSYPFGIDQPAVCKRHGLVRVYMPRGELAASKTWEVIRALTGGVIGSIVGGSHPHNTICHRHDVLMGGRRSRYLYQTNGPRVGPSPAAQKGVRPFVVNAANTRVYLTWTRFRGFSVGNLRTGRIIATRNFGPIPPGFTPTAASHGISLNPTGSRVYVLDTPLRQVRVYTAGSSPRHLATISIPDGLRGNESPCRYDCGRDGWLLHSLSGRYVFVGDSGDVIRVATRHVVAFLPALENTRHGFLEVVWRHGRPVASTGHFGIGR